MGHNNALRLAGLSAVGELHPPAADSSAGRCHPGDLAGNGYSVIAHQAQQDKHFVTKLKLLAGAWHKQTAVDQKRHVRVVELLFVLDVVRKYPFLSHVINFPQVVPIAIAIAILTASGQREDPGGPRRAVTPSGHAVPVPKAASACVRQTLSANAPQPVSRLLKNRCLS